MYSPQTPTVAVLSGLIAMALGRDDHPGGVTRQGRSHFPPTAEALP
jgi:hypothetical protein